MSVSSGQIRNGLYALLTSISDVNAVVGTRIFPALVPQTQDGVLTTPMPFIVWRRTSCTREYTMQGPTGQCEVLVEIDCYARRYDEACDLADALRRGLDGYRDDTSTTTIAQVQLTNEYDALEFPSGNETLRDFRVTQVYEVHFYEQVDT